MTEVQTQVQAKVAEQRARLDELQKSLEQRLRELTGFKLPLRRLLAVADMLEEPKD